MKRSFSFLIVALLLALAHAFPRTAQEEEPSEAVNPNTDTWLILPNHRWPIRSSLSGFPTLDVDVDDDDHSGFFGGNPFTGLGFENIFTRMKDVMKKAREQVEESLSGIGGLLPRGKIPEGANTTSVTKVIDGHVVTINETIAESEDGNSFFHIRTVDVKPEGGVDIPQSSEDKSGTDNKPTESTKESTSARSVESVEDSDRNEIPDSQVETLTA